MADWDDIRRTIDYIEKLPVLPEDDEGLDPRRDYWAQDQWGVNLSVLVPSLAEDACGTAACLAGWKARLDGKADWVSAGSYAREAWGLTSEQADALFYALNTIARMREMVDMWEKEENGA